MRILLDTHTFIWWDDDHSQLSATALTACKDKSNTLLLSVASIWEMQIKIQIGKLRFSIPLEEKIRNQQKTNKLQILQITPKHVFALNRLPDHHKDPFDRILIAQALYENIPFMSQDPIIAKYPIRLLW